MSETSTVEIINPLQCTGWDELLLTEPHSTFFHSSHWARVLYATYGYKPLYFTVRDNGNISALIPLMEIDSFLTGKRGVSLPFTDFCQPIISDTIRADKIWETIREYGEKAGWKYIEIRGGNGLSKNIPLSSWCYGHSIFLSQDTQDVYSNFHDSHKRNIKKAQKLGVEVSAGDSLELIKEFYRLNVITRKRHGLPPQPFWFFKNIHQFVIEQKHGLLLLARHQGKVVAGALCFQFGDKAIYKYAASDKRFQNLRANNLILWKALDYYSQQGFCSFNLGRTDKGHEGLRQFKSGWGAKETTINYYRYFFQHQRSTTTVPTVDGYHTNVFKKLPLPILKIMGKIFYKHIG
ncbi:peptidoglycan bridge formation glycyltransferase FemA/FemB family protein [Desulfopila sp. IMCC35006]|uniref:lipid II:glycine glycyltransferase FemX n=1 Tax=Desulfopila sp. IMCC35006 TaxID=2569542 RepID=UPI0010AB6D28|nr:GNAT family N-acetyltransferase [Desulfopila sp. IMCC35006]TKB23221.1 peptidoglycan bridge formation glycyltransferase FemA/FemB family protein [Desulfopila sp. IMCC35006]